MKEQLISFDTAKLAKEKGFIPATHSFYNEKGNIEYNGFDNWNVYVKAYSAPTQSLLQKWLREKKILVEVLALDDWNTYIARVYGKDLMSPFFEAFTSKEYKTYEEALEKGLQEALKLI